jgi:hypothetical protein
MTTFPILTLKRRKTIVTVFFFILFVFLLVAFTPDFHSYFIAGIRFSTYLYLAGVSIFFIHNLILIPLILEEQNSRKYLLLTLVCFLIFAIIELILFSAMISGRSGNNIFGIIPSHLFNFEQLINISATICIPLLIIGFLSIFYILLIYGLNKITPYLEFIVHVFILMVLFIFAVHYPQVSTKEVLAISIALLVFYTNTFLITPLLRKDQMKLIYLTALIGLCAIYFLVQLIVNKTFDFIKFDPDTGNRITNGRLIQMVFSAPNIFILFITIFLSFIYGYLRIRSKAEEKLFRLNLGRKESELHLLKSQVNPHFLFNALNLLYATSLIENAEKTGESIIRLASLIRYMQEDINKDFIPLENEVKYVQDYIAIQKLRCAVEPQIETSFVNIENHYISPGLFIPFIENSFKYGIDPSKPSNLTVSVNCDQKKINFMCVNSYNEEFKAYYKEQGFGIGIKNARQRLELVYPNKHTIEINKENNSFSVMISITTKTK